MTAPLYVYLAYGPSPATPRELRYSVETLLPEIGGDPQRIAVFTDHPEFYADMGIRIVDIGPDMRDIMGSLGYRHRAKPVILARALRLFQRPCVLMDTDSFMRPGFDRVVRQALAEGAAMNQFVRRDPYPDFRAFETELPHLGRYVLDRGKSLMLNSGLVAANPEHLPLIDDAVELIDRLWLGGLLRHDVEQFAIAEGFRLGGVKIRLIDREFEHYCPRWARRYMRRALRERAPGERVPYGKMRVRLFKWGWLLKLWARRLRK